MIISPSYHTNEETRLYAHLLRQLVVIKFNCNRNEAVVISKVNGLVVRRGMSTGLRTGLMSMAGTILTMITGVSLITWL